MGPVDNNQPAPDTEGTAASTSPPPPSFTRELALIIAVLSLGLGFIFSYVGAFHDPVPHRVNIAVAAPAKESSRLVLQLNAITGHPLAAHAVTAIADARRQVQNDQTAAALLVSPTGSKDRLLVATGGGVALTTAVQSVIEQAERRQHRTVLTRDLAPLQTGDYRGLTGFYAVVGWLVTGYLLAALLGIAAKARDTTLRSVTRRLLILVPYSIAAGLGGSLILDTLLAAETGHFLALAGVGALLVFAAASVTIALQELVGIIGIGLAILLFVVLGNPSAGGAYQIPLLPGFWRTIGDALPNGAGVDTLRRITYFHGHGITDHLIIIGAYCLAAVLIALTVTAYRTTTTQSTLPSTDARAAS